MTLLKLVALDGEDLGVVSAHLQDAILRLEDVTYLADTQCFAAVVNRFDWEGAEQSGKRSKKKFERRRTTIRFERVQSVQRQNLAQDARKLPLSLLSIEFLPRGDGPDGHILLTFSGGGVIRLEVECVEVQMEDLGAAWQTGRRPDHGEDPGDPGNADGEGEA